jgi:anaerobic selenocysteine-containing dehydrogenase
MPARTLTTTCPMDCPDTCALEVSVANGRVQRIGAGRDHPDTGEFICTKVRRFARRQYHEDRLLYPERRTGPKGSGQYQRIAWDDAIGEITERFRTIAAEWGAEAILPYHYGGSNGKLSDDQLDALFFARLGASRLAKTICAVPTTLAATGMYGKMPGVPFADYPLAQCIVIWGANPKASNIHLVPYLKEAKRRGAFIVVVDPARNFSDQEADLHLPVLPGTDLPLALALIKLWHDGGKLDTAFLEAHAIGSELILDAAAEWPLARAAEVTGVPASDIATLAEAYANATPAVIRCGWGLERNVNGAQAAAAVLAIPALLGKFGVPGGGYTMSNSGAVPFTRHAIALPEWRTRVINMTQLGAVLTEPLDPPVHALFVYNSNPVATTPDQNRVIRGLAREDLFTVVFDQVRTDTAQYADIVLPATTFLEHWDLRVAYGAYVVGGTRPVVDAEGEARSNHDVFAALGRAMGWDDESFAWDQATAFARVAEALAPNGGHVDLDRVRAGAVQPVYPRGGPVQFGTEFPRTPDRKIHLAPAVLGPHPYRYEAVGDARYPLALITPANDKMISSSLGEFNYPELCVDLHQRDAAARGIADGDEVRVFNDLGEVICRARVRGKVRPGVVLMPKGAWRKSSRNGRTSTALCPAAVNAVGGAARFNDARVEIERTALA